MTDRSKYSRVYWRVLDDSEFDGIRDNPKLFGSWTLMLLSADMAWPSPAYVPPFIATSSLTALSGAGLIEMLSGGRFRLRGITKERNARKAAATRDPIGTQGGPKGVPEGRIDKQSKAETRQDEHTSEPVGVLIDDDDKDPADVYWRITGKYPNDKTLPWIDQLAERYGADAVSRALVVSHIADRSPQTLLGRTQDRLRAEARELDRKERSDEQQRLREKRAVPRVEEPWKVEWRKAMELRYQGDAA